MKKFILSLLLTTSAQAYTFNNNFEARFKSDNVNIYVDDQTSCYGAGMTVEELQGFISKAADRFWNRVPTSALRLKTGGFVPAIANINTGILCAPTDEKCITDAPAGTVIPPVSDIVVAC